MVAILKLKNCWVHRLQISNASTFMLTFLPFYVFKMKNFKGSSHIRQLLLTLSRNSQLKTSSKIWNLMSPFASVNLKICSLSFKSLEYQEENEEIHFLSPLEILKYIEERNEKQFTFQFSNGPKKKQFTIIMNSNLPNEEKKKMKVLVDLSQPDSSLSLI